MRPKCPPPKTKKEAYYNLFLTMKNICHSYRLLFLIQLLVVFYGTDPDEGHGGHAQEEEGDASTSEGLDQHLLSP